MSDYYNEIDLYAAQWLRNLIAAGLLAPGVVDTRSIEDVRPSDLTEFTQCHFFAGIGIWSYALRAAGWPADRPVWTGSCPCQPFSTAGQGSAFDDERHLWPAFHHLIKERRPESIFGEQVASKDADPWIDLVQDDLEALGYAVGAVPFPSASVGAPHIRDRLYWYGKREPVGQADSNNKRLERRRGMRERAVELPAWPSGMAGGLADNVMQQRSDRAPRFSAEYETAGWKQSTAEVAGFCSDSRLAHDQSERCREAGSGSGRSAQRTSDSGKLVGMEYTSGDGWQQRRTESSGGGAKRGREPNELVIIDLDTGIGTGPTNGLWSGTDWLFCRDGKWRPVEARIQQVVDGYPASVGLLCAELQEKIEEILNEAARRLQTEAASLLREVREATDSTGFFQWRGGVFSVHEAQVLLGYLREYTRQEGDESNTNYGSGQTGRAQRDLRVLWGPGTAFNPPRERRLEGQQARELADALRLLSSAMARFASEAGYKNLYEDAAASFPLGSILYPDSMGELRPKDRIGRLRAYGNAINAEQARIFIETAMEYRP